MPVVCMTLSEVLKGMLASSSRGIALQESARGSLNMIVNETSSYWAVEGLLARTQRAWYARAPYVGTLSTCVGLATFDGKSALD